MPKDSHEEWHEEYWESRGLLGRVLAAPFRFLRFFWGVRFSFRTEESNKRDPARYASLIAERTFLRDLSWRKGFLIDDAISTENILYKKQNFEIDALVFKKGVGLIVIEVKNYSGEVYASNLNSWRRIQRGEESTSPNPCLQVQRTASILRKLLLEHGLKPVPIHTVVVFVNKSVNLRIEPAPYSPQTLVMTGQDFLARLPKFKSNGKIKLTRNYAQRVKSLLIQYESEFSQQ